MIKICRDDVCVSHIGDKWDGDYTYEDLMYIVARGVYVVSYSSNEHRLDELNDAERKCGRRDMVQEVSEEQAAEFAAEAVRIDNGRDSIYKNFYGNPNRKRVDEFKHGSERFRTLFEENLVKQMRYQAMSREETELRLDIQLRDRKIKDGVVKQEERDKLDEIKRALQQFKDESKLKDMRALWKTGPAKNSGATLA